MYVAALKDQQEAFKWLPYTPITTTTALEQFLNTWVYPDPGLILFAIKDKTRSSAEDIQGEVTIQTFGGVITLMNGSVANACVEIGHILIVPDFQRTHVLTNACGILLQYALNRPEEGGLGLRRVQWQANEANLPSVGAAKRLGFHFEGILRWHRVLPPGKVGPATREDGRGAGRHTAILSICFDDWEGGVKEALQEKMVLRKK